jgi:vacuolar-type H+-ATPase subunit E/Vma4
MELFNRKEGSNTGWGFKAPSYDPYGQYRNSTPGIFGFRKDKHVVMPGVTAYESMRLNRVRQYVEEQTNQPCTLSQELINDVYSIYVNGEVKRRPNDGSNSIRHKVLDKVYDYLTKVVTVDSPLFTNILTRELALVLQKIDDEVRKEQEKQGKPGNGLESGQDEKGQQQEGEGDEQEGKDGSDASGQSDAESNGAGKSAGGDSVRRDDDLEKMVDKVFEDNSKEIEKAKDEADKKIKELESQLSKDDLKTLSNGNPEFLDEVDKLREIIKDLNFNKNSIRSVLDKILNESQNYFSTKHTVVEENIFECEECEDLFGLEFLNPIFKNAEILNMGNNSRVYKGKFDLYVDCSGSMSSEETFENKRIRMMNLAKGIASTLNKMGLIENLYFFESQLYKVDNVNDLTILGFSKSGGTNFNLVMEKIQEEGNNSVILTDGFNGCNIYDKKAFWIGVGGTQFKGYGRDESNAFNMFRRNNQCVAYNPQTSKFDYCTQE